MSAVILYGSFTGAVCGDRLIAGAFDRSGNAFYMDDRAFFIDLGDKTDSGQDFRDGRVAAADESASVFKSQDHQAGMRCAGISEDRAG